MTRRVRTDTAVLVVGPIPPPLHGYSLITDLMARRLSETATIETLDISPDGSDRGWSYHAQRLRRVAGALLRLICRSVRRHRTLYLAIAGGAGVIYDLLLAAAARACGYRIFIHHHAFTYLNARSHWTAMLIAIAGRTATHVCLCPTMAQRLREHYSFASKIVILSNAAFVVPAPVQREPRPGPFRVGFLSNLLPEKGLDTAIDVVRLLREQQHEVTLSIAGPLTGHQSHALVERARQVLGDAMEYLGPVDGARKAAFFRCLDVFIFPTRYPNEAEPLVVLEALAAGVPVITTARGCLRDDVAAGGVVLDSGAFTSAAAQTIAGWLADRQSLWERSAVAHERAAELNREARKQLDALIAAITSNSSQLHGV